MKTAIITLCLILCATLAFGATLSWGPPDGSAPVDGYKVYVNDQAPVTVQDTSYDVGTLVNGTAYEWKVTAFNKAGESAPAVLRYTHQEAIVVEMPSRPSSIVLNFD